MKNPRTFSTNAQAAHTFSQGCFATLLAGFIAVSCPVVVSQAQAEGPEDTEAEVLTRGPVHEAFAGVISYNPQPGIVVKKAPPELIEEIPPAEKPEGDEIVWIPGYWAWDDERDDFLWVSGTWRALPPGREWIAGYWRDTEDGYQWISGYWADAAAQETTYLPPPPETLEVGPNIDPPSPDYGWTPGCWEWQQDRYAWRAGYWAPGRMDWVWVPSYYIWTPRGVIFVAGFWDYVVERRGLLFAPVYYRSPVRRGYHYSPRIVTSVSIFDDCLFLRPNYHHYYFGDYYDSRYDRSGFYASFWFQSRHRGYEPFYAHRRWEHRADRDWDNRFRESYRYRRDHEAARPPRTWSAHATINARPGAGGPARTPLAAPIEQLAARTDNPVRFQRVAEGDRQRFSQRGREMQQTREQRRTVEARPTAAEVRSESAPAAPARVAAPRSPFVGKPSGPRVRNQVSPDQPPAPPAAPNAPAPVAIPERGPGAGPRNVTPDPRQPGAERRGRPDRRAEAAPGANVPPAVEPPAVDTAAPVPSEPPRRTRSTRERVQDPGGIREQAIASPPAAGDGANAAAARAQEEANRRDQRAYVMAQATENRARDAAEKARQGLRAQQDAADRSNADAMQAREEFQRQQRANMKAQQESAERTRGVAERAQEAARAQLQATEQANVAAARAREESRREEQGRERAQANERRRDQVEAAARAQQQAAERATAAARAQEAARGQQQQAAERANASAAAARAQEEVQRKQEAGREPPAGTRRGAEGDEAERASRGKARPSTDEDNDARKKR